MPSASNFCRWMSKVVVHTTPEGAKILVDEKDTGYRSPVNFDLPAGKHTIRAERSGFASETREVTVLNNQTTQFEMVLKSDKKHRRFLVFP